MKTRTNHVSNSSSSSFVVIPERVVQSVGKMTSDSIKSKEKSLKSVFMSSIISDGSSEDGKWKGFLDGEMKFGWQTRNYTDLESKWNWLVLQAYYGGTERDRRRTIEFCLILDGYLHDLDIEEQIDWELVARNVSDFDAYIDHQSIDAVQTFSDVNSVGITEWLSNNSCYVKNGNDNG